jgi:V/A-type H+-transporting ATPase subunit E
MVATPVSDKILAEAKEQAKRILAEANKEIEQIQAQAKKELEQLDKQIQADLEQASAQEQHRILAGARQAVTAELLQTKHEMLDKVFAGAKKALAKMPAEDYQKMLASWLKEAVVTGDEEVLAAKGEKNLSQELLDNLNKKLKNGKLKLSKEKVAGSGGFVLEEEKTRTRVTWEVLLSQARRELEPELSKKLFADRQDKPKN